MLGATLRVVGHPALELPVPGGAGASAAWPWELRFHAPPERGIEVTLRLAGTRLPRIGVTDVTDGLDGLPGVSPRPSDLVRPPAGPPSDVVIVTRTVPPGR